jgi:hypothetical protein
MKILITLSIMTFSFSSFAISNSKLVNACKPAGITKLQAQAKAKGLEVRAEDVKECGIDNRLLNPVKYVWFCATTTDGSEKITKLTQKAPFKPCF